MVHCGILLNQRITISNLFDCIYIFFVCQYQLPNLYSLKHTYLPAHIHMQIKLGNIGHNVWQYIDNSMKTAEM